MIRRTRPFIRSAHIDQAGFHDASILGEAANPRNFNTLRRIRDEDGTAIEEEERFTELAGVEAFSQQLREFLDTHGREAVEALPDGIHSGLARQGARGVFFYFRADTADGPQHFWRYLDLCEDRILDNRHFIASLIACQRDTPRVVEPLLWERIFDLQEEAIADILRSVGERASLEATARLVDPVQQSVSTVLQTALQESQVDHARAVAAIRFLAQPMVNVEIRELRAAFRRCQNAGDVAELLATVEALRDNAGGAETPESAAYSVSAETLRRDQLRLICFDLITGG